MSGVRFSEAELRKNPRYAHLVAAAARETSKPARGESKYHNQLTDTPDGTFDSKREAIRWGELKLLEKGGLVTGLQRQVRFKLFSTTITGGVALLETYVADFVYVEIPEGRFVVEDTKGAITQTYQRKRRLMKQLYGITILES